MHTPGGDVCPLQRESPGDNVHHSAPSLPESFFQGLCRWNRLSVAGDLWPALWRHSVETFLSHYDLHTLLLKFVKLKITTFCLGSYLLDSYLTEAFYLLIFSVLMQLHLSFQPSLSRGVAKIMWLFLFWRIPDLPMSLCNVGYDDKANINSHNHQNNNSIEHFNVLSTVLKTLWPLTHFILSFMKRELLLPPF